ncbi:MAG: trimethylguanosine synthase [Candidatus Thermoplasmatota archaeon]|nr:trimethylguanosine synthase [Candidatus Thermoplasmatota archaeon]MCL5442054.1 trimethylguanosine synthase [Candidatus Thermoplasmatota archaeon]
MNEQTATENLLSRCLTDKHYRDTIDRRIDGIVDLIDRGHDGKSILKNAGKRVGREITFLIEIARSRVQTRGKFSRSNRLWLDNYTARYSTPESVARYRAQRISGETILDIGSGGGMQAIFFSESNTVKGLEKDRIRYLESQINAEVYGAKNLEFINSEWPSLKNNNSNLQDALIFSDPLRESGSKERELKDLIPSPADIIRNYSGITGKFAFDIPPQIRREKLGIDAETEYISVNGSLNRLTLYCGPLKNAESSAVILPAGIKISGRYEPPDFQHAEKVLEFIELPDPSLIYAGLVNQVKKLGDFSFLGGDKRRIVLTSSVHPEEPFPGKIYRNLAVCQLDEIQEKLVEIGAGKIYPRFEIQPEEYYAMKNRFEAATSGEREIFIFRVGPGYVLSEQEVKPQ